MMDHPIFLFLVSLAVLWLATWVGGSIVGRRWILDDDSRADHTSMVGAILTLLGLIIGFSFSMAVSRYDLRKSYEQAEANAIGTEFVRADLLPAADAQRVRVLLTNYVDLRIRNYVVHDQAEIGRLKAQTSRLEDQLWAAVRDSATTHQPPMALLVMSGMNDVFNTQRYTQAAWWNRIPRSAWFLMSAIALAGCTLIGFGARAFKTAAYFIWVLPAVISISFFLIADMDDPRGGLIRVRPQNLVDLAQSMQSRVANPPHA
ncbi:MAG TPA: hypothetical protein VGH03_09145 [Caulobacteraceae bacterium]|jgi:hypothetical protein